MDAAVEAAIARAEKTCRDRGTCCQGLPVRCEACQGSLRCSGSGGGARPACRTVMTEDGPVTSGPFACPVHRASALRRL